MNANTEAGKLYAGVVDYVVNASGTTRHYVLGEDNPQAGPRDITVTCGRTIKGAYVIESTKLDPYNIASGLTTCRNCSRRAIVPNLVTRERAAELDAAAPAAVEVEQPAEAVEPANVINVNGGKVHNRAAFAVGDVDTSTEAFPECRTGTMSSRATRYRLTDQPVDCRDCVTQNERRALAAVAPVEAAVERIEAPAVEQPAPAKVHDAIMIEDIPGVWIVTHTPDSLAEHVSHAPGGHTPVTRITSAFGYYRARHVYVGGPQFMPIIFAGHDIQPATNAAADAEVGQLGVWFTAGNGPIIVPIPEEFVDHAPSYAGRVRMWQQDTGRDLDAVVVVRLDKGWVDGVGKTVAPAPEVSTPVEAVVSEVYRQTIAAGAAPAPEVEVEQPAPVEAPPSPVDAPPAPALPQVDDASPLARRDLVTYNGSRYVIIRADSLAERERAEGQVELYPGDVLPDHIPYGERGHWVEASACSRRLVLEWGTRHPEAGRMVFVDHPGRAYAECVVESIARWGDGSARLVVRVRGGEWQLAPMRAEAEREADAAAFLASLD